MVQWLFVWFTNRRCEIESHQVKLRMFFFFLFLFFFFFFFTFFILLFSLRLFIIKIRYHIYICMCSFVSLAAPVAEWLRLLNFSSLNRSSSHRCGLEPSSGHMWDKPSSACRWSCGFSLGSTVFAPPSIDSVQKEWNNLDGPLTPRPTPPPPTPQKK